ncbi:MAG: nucleotide exchange factor GrpE [Vicinamibacterales bacterium]
MSDLKVTDRRWWVRGDADPAPAADEPKLKPTYVEELEAKIATKDEEIQRLVAQYRSASDEFDQARARLRKEVTKDVERGRRSMLVSFLEVLDNLDRALEAAATRTDDPLVQGVSLVRQQFLTTLEGFGVARIDPIGQPFDPTRHEAVATMAATDACPAGTVSGVVKPGYLIGEDVLRAAQVAVAG